MEFEAVVDPTPKNRFLVISEKESGKYSTLQGVFHILSFIPISLCCVFSSLRICGCQKTNVS